ncbi:MAG: hypothetical protein IJ460_05570 [Clostridia bacterium]|nr:hypothetical protein [Clostridia bacterium]
MKKAKRISVFFTVICIVASLFTSFAVSGAQDDTVTVGTPVYEVGGKIVPLPMAGDVKIKAAAAGTGNATLIAAVYNKETLALEDVALSDEAVLSGGYQELTATVSITDLSKQNLRLFVWDMSTLKPYTVPANEVTYSQAVEMADYYAINTYSKTARFKNLTHSLLANKSYFDDSNYYIWQVCSYGNNGVKPHSVSFVPTDVTENTKKDYTIYVYAAGTNAGDKLHLTDGDNEIAAPNATITLNNTWNLEDKTNNATFEMHKIQAQDWDVTSDLILGMNKATGNISVREIYIFETKNVSDELDSLIRSSSMGRYEDAAAEEAPDTAMTFAEAAALADYSAEMTDAGIVGDIINTNTAGGYFNTQYFAWEPAQWDNKYNFNSSKVTGDISGDYTMFIMAGSYAVGDTSKNGGNGALHIYDGQENSVEILSIAPNTIVLADHQSSLIEDGYTMYKVRAENWQMTKDSVVKFNSSTKHGTFIRKFYIFESSKVTPQIETAMMSGL